MVKGMDAHAHGTSLFGQASPPGAHLEEGGDDDPWRRAQSPGRFAHEVQNVSGLAGGSGTHIEIDSHADLCRRSPVLGLCQ